VGSTQTKNTEGKKIDEKQHRVMNASGCAGALHFQVMLNSHSSSRCTHILLYIVRVTGIHGVCDLHQYGTGPVPASICASPDGMFRARNAQCIPVFIVRQLYIYLIDYQRPELDDNAQSWFHTFLDSDPAPRVQDH